MNKGILFLILMTQFSGVALSRRPPPVADEKYVFDYDNIYEKQFKQNVSFDSLVMGATQTVKDFYKEVEKLREFRENLEKRDLTADPKAYNLYHLFLKIFQFKNMKPYLGIPIEEFFDFDNLGREELKKFIAYLGGVDEGGEKNFIFKIPNQVKELVNTVWNDIVMVAQNEWYDAEKLSPEERFKKQEEIKERVYNFEDKIDSLREDFAKMVKAKINNYTNSIKTRLEQGLPKFVKNLPDNFLEVNDDLKFNPKHVQKFLSNINFWLLMSVLTYYLDTNKQIHNGLEEYQGEYEKITKKISELFIESLTAENKDEVKKMLEENKTKLIAPKINVEYFREKLNKLNKLNSLYAESIAKEDKYKEIAEKPFYANIQENTVLNDSKKTKGNNKDVPHISVSPIRKLTKINNKSSQKKDGSGNNPYDTNF